MPRDIVVVGAGGFGREALDVIEAINEHAEAPIWNLLGVADDAPAEVALGRLAVRGHRHIGRVRDVIEQVMPAWYAVAIGSPRAREAVVAQFEAAGWNAATLVHPSAVIGSVSSMGEGTIVCGGAQLSTNTLLGRHVHVNPGAIVGHDTRLGDLVSVNPGAVISGEVRVDARALIGASATILQGLSVGADALVAAAACVTRSVGASTTVVGIPARAVEESAP